MGKAKKRILHKSNSNLYMTRESAVSRVCSMIKGIKGANDESVSELITLFGLSAEELSEGGMPYENLAALDLLVY